MKFASGMRTVLGKEKKSEEKNNKQSFLEMETIRATRAEIFAKKK